MNNQVLSVLLVDDESLAIANLTIMIKSYCNSMRIIDTASSVEEGIQKTNDLKPDVIFLDVNMPKQNGFELLNHINHIPSVVFVTAHEQYALRAMKVCAVDYLMKPIAISELKQTQVKLLQIHTIKPEIRKNYSQILRNLSAIIDKPGTIKKITLYGNNGYEIFDIEDILYLSGEDNYTTFHFLNQKGIMVSRTLKDYEEILEPSGFMRIHKSTIVNLFHVKKILRNETLDAVLTNGIQLHVSRRKMADLLEWSRSQTD